jgi:hypothetical protein
VISVEIGDVSRLSDALGLSARFTRSSNRRDIIADQRRAEVEIFAKLT